MPTINTFNQKKRRPIVPFEVRKEKEGIANLTVKKKHQSFIDFTIYLKLIAFELNVFSFFNHNHYTTWRGKNKVSASKSLRRFSAAEKKSVDKTDTKCQCFNLPFSVQFPVDVLLLIRLINFKHNGQPRLKQHFLSAHRFWEIGSPKKYNQMNCNCKALAPPCRWLLLCFVFLCSFLKSQVGFLKYVNNLFYI